MENTEENWRYRNCADQGKWTVMTSRWKLVWVLSSLPCNQLGIFLNEKLLHFPVKEWGTSLYFTKRPNWLIQLTHMEIEVRIIVVWEKEKGRDSWVIFKSAQPSKIHSRRSSKLNMTISEPLACISENSCRMDEVPKDCKRAKIALILQNSGE